MIIIPTGNFLFHFIVRAFSIQYPLYFNCIPTKLVIQQICYKRINFYFRIQNCKTCRSELTFFPKKLKWIIFQPRTLCFLFFAIFLCYLSISPAIFWNYKIFWTLWKYVDFDQRWFSILMVEINFDIRKNISTLTNYLLHTKAVAVSWEWSLNRLDSLLCSYPFFVKKLMFLYSFSYMNAEIWIKLNYL